MYTGNLDTLRMVHDFQWIAVILTGMGLFYGLSFGSYYYVYKKRTQSTL